MEYPTIKQDLAPPAKPILFVTSQLRQREIKMACALKSLGWKVDLIYYNWTPFNPEGYFNFIQEVKSAEEAHKLAKELAPQVIHAFSGAIDDYILLFCHNKIAPVVIDLNDVFTPSLMNYCPERYALTKKALKTADGFCARDLQIKCSEKLDKYKLPPRVLFYPEYCWNNPATSVPKKSDQEIHIVSVGTISLETYGMFDCCYLELVERILKQGIHFHIYPPWCYRKNYHNANPHFERDYAQFLELARKYPQLLHIHDSLPVEALANALHQYDFGIISGGCKEFGQRYTHFKPAYVEACYSGRITDYLDANLPVLINDEVVFNYRLLNRYGVGIDLKGLLQPGFKEKLQAIKQSSAFQKQIEKTRATLSISKNAPRLAAFYLDVMHSTKLDVPHPSMFKRLTRFITKNMRLIN